VSIPELRQSDSGVFYIHWTDGRRSKRVSTRTRNLDAAKAFLGSWLLMEREAPANAAATLTVADLWSVYNERHVKRNVLSPDTLRWSWKNLEPHFGHLSIAAVTPEVVEDYERKRIAGKIGRKAMSRRELDALRACFNWSADPAKHRKPIIAAADLPVFELPEASAPRDRWLKTEEIQRLLNAAATMRQGSRLSRGERFLWIALETAARKQAIFDLTWDRVDFETGVIDFKLPGRRETKKRRSVVPISKALRPVLERAYAERLDKRPGSLVMDNKGEIWATIQSIAERAGFGEPRTTARSNGEKPKSTGISPHVLRHTAATHMARRGVPLWIIAKILGNTLVMVERVYAKHCPEDLRAAVDTISGGALEASA
jgi:integrase